MLHDQQAQPHRFTFSKHPEGVFSCRACCRNQSPLGKDAAGNGRRANQRACRCAHDSLLSIDWDYHQAKVRGSLRGVCVRAFAAAVGCQALAIRGVQPRTSSVDDPATEQRSIDRGAWKNEASTCTRLHSRAFRASAGKISMGD